MGSRRTRRNAAARLLVVSLDETDAEGRYLHEPADTPTRRSFIDRRWALTLLDNVLRRLEREMQHSRKGRAFHRAESALTGGQVAFSELPHNSA